MRSHLLISQRIGLKVMFLVQMLTMIGFSIIFSLLVLYCTKVLNMSDADAYAISSSFNALAFALSLLGGYLGESFLGYRFATAVSLILSVLGLFVLAFDNITALFWGLALFVVGTGIIIPCTYVLLGRLYEQHDVARESGFTYIYIGMNIGAFIASLFSGVIANNLGYYFAYLLGAVASFFALIIFLLYQRTFKLYRASTRIRIRPETIKRTRIYGLIIVVFAVLLTVVLLNHADFSNVLMIVAGIFSFFLVLYLARSQDVQTRNKMLVFLILTTFSVAIWALYMLMPSVFVIFTQRNVDRHLLGFLIPTATYSALNPFFIISLGPLMSIWWRKTNLSKKYQISLPMKFALGSFFMGFGILIVVLGIYFQNITGYINSSWVVASYLLQTIGELFVGPIGYAMVGQLIPMRYEGLMMGIWQLATGVAGALSDYLSNYAEPNQNLYDPLLTNAAYSHAFLIYGCITVLVGLIIVTITPMLKNMLE